MHRFHKHRGDIGHHRRCEVRRGLGQSEGNELRSQVQNAKAAGILDQPG